MKKEMRFQNLITHEVPGELDNRILAAAAKKAAELRAGQTRRRRFWISSTMASAAALLIVTTANLLPGKTGTPQAPATDLLALSDWTGIEQEYYNLSFELDSGRRAISELADAHITKGL